jgi:hypothetical protein
MHLPEIVEWAAVLCVYISHTALVSLLGQLCGAVWHLLLL